MWALRFSAMLAAFLVASCAPLSAPPLTPPSIPVTSLSSAAGPWQHVAIGQRTVRDGYRLEFMYPNGNTFIASKGCVIAQGTLEPAAGGGWRINRYDEGFASDACGPFRPGPAVAPFDGDMVKLGRAGDRLLVEAGGRSYLFDPIAVERRVATIGQVAGLWVLLDGAGRPASGKNGASLRLATDRFELRGPCATYRGGQPAFLEGLRIVDGSAQVVRQSAPCGDERRGDRLVRAVEQADIRFVPESDRIRITTPGGDIYLFGRVPVE